MNEKKEDIHYKEIPKLQNGDAESRKSLGIYCLKVRVCDWRFGDDTLIKSHLQDVYLPLLLFEKLQCFEKQLKEARKARVPFNTLRVWKGLAVTTKTCLDAIERQYVVADKLT